MKTIKILKAKSAVSIIVGKETYLEIVESEYVIKNDKWNVLISMTLDEARKAKIMALDACVKIELITNKDFVLEQIKQIGEETIRLQEGTKWVDVAFKNIARVSRYEKANFFYIDDDRQYHSRLTLNELENILPPLLFCRVNHGHIIGRRHIEKVEYAARGGMITLDTPKDIELSHLKTEDFKVWYEIAL